MTTFTFAFSDTQIDILKTSLETRLQRIEKMIEIFSEDTDDAGSRFMVDEFNRERAEAEALLQDLTNATSFLPSA